jgi:dTDP-D-glucose 4,6-dehydratase
VNELFSKLSQVITKDEAKPQYAGARKGEQMRSVCTYQKIQTELGWKPKVSVEEGLNKTVEYFRDQQGK